MRAELLFRPFAVLDEGARVHDAVGRTWIFRAPFFFIDDTGTRGVPLWPIEVPGSPGVSAILNRASRESEVAAFEAAAGVDGSVFDIVRPDDD